MQQHIKFMKITHIPSIIKDTGFDPKRVQVKEKNELFSKISVKMGKKTKESVKITQIEFL